MDESSARLLSEAVEATPRWVRDTVLATVSAQRLETGDIERELGTAADEARVYVEQELGRLLRTEFSQQRTTPLSVFREATEFPNRLLDDLGAAPHRMNPTSPAALTNDRYGIMPAALSDVGEAVGEAGIIWGATKASVHLRRRQQLAQPEQSGES